MNIHLISNKRVVVPFVESDMSTGKSFFRVILLSVFLSLITGCNTQTAGKKTLSPHLEKTYKRLNGFVDDLYILHKKRLEGREFYTSEEVGGYGGLTNDLEFYNKINYYDSMSKQLLSTIKWERKNPGNIHMIDLFVYDNQGRLKRNYAAAYLPFRRTAPFDTSISLHYYTDDTHSFREFDASNIQFYEQCSDVKDEKKTYFAFHYQDIPNSYKELDVAKRDSYRVCFDHASRTAEPYISPLNELIEKIPDS